MWCLGRAGAPRRAVGSRSAQRPCAAGLRRERPCRQSTPAARTCHSTTSCASWRALKRCAGAPHAAAVGGSADAAAMATPSCTALTRGMTSACPPCGPHAPMRPPCAPHARVNPLRPPIRPPAPPCGLRAGQGQARFEKATPRRVQGQKRPAPQRRHIPDLPPAAAQGALGAPGQSNAAAPGSRARSPLACGASRAQHAGTGGSPCDAPPPPSPLTRAQHDRRMYGMKEAALAAVLVDACGVDKKDKTAARLLNWCAAPGAPILGRAGPCSRRAPGDACRAGAQLGARLCSARAPFSSRLRTRRPACSATPARQCGARAASASPPAPCARARLLRRKDDGSRKAGSTFADVAEAVSGVAAHPCGGPARAPCAAHTA